MKNKMIRNVTTLIASLMIVCSVASPMNVLAFSETEKMKAPEHFLNIGSVSKMFTVASVMILKEQGKVDLDAPVTDYISDFSMADERYKDITVRMLMDHSSGLMGSVYHNSLRIDDVNTDYHDAFLDALRCERLKADPGSYNCYCNDGFTLLEILVERVSGMTFTDFVEQYICEPLGLESTGTIWNISDLDKQITYYAKDDIKMMPETVLCIGAGGIMSTAEDLCTFGYSFCYGNDTILSDDSKREMAESHKASEYCDDYGFGWDSVTTEDYENAGVKVVAKSGDTTYQHSSVAVAPDHDISVAVLSSGGSSSVDLDIAYDLMDIALEEKGIKVDHPEKEMPSTESKVPDEYLAYEGNYTDVREIVKITFPEERYMQIETLTSSDPEVMQYMYTAEGRFVTMTGDIDSGNAIVEKPVSTVDFITVDGKMFVISDDGIALQKVDDNNVSDDIQKAWDERNKTKYYICNGAYSDASYISNPYFELNTSPEAKGYVNGSTIIDEDHAVIRTDIPNDTSRDVSDITVVHDGDKEFLVLEDFGYTCISEKNIGVFDKDIKKVDLHTGEATWYKIDGLESTTLDLKIPENASVTVFDQNGELLYSSFMRDYGNTVPLPNYGMIVFVGESGSSIEIR
ncbi:MAG: beta-lactamase family protein [Clostridiales bacterium]|nr:beta-lactamase family protein [Clostridiales bacterium]